MVGILGGGWLADLLGRRDPRWYARLPALMIGLGLPFYLGAGGRARRRPPLCSEPVRQQFHRADLCRDPDLMPDRSRAFASAVLLFVISLIGFGLARSWSAS